MKGRGTVLLAAALATAAPLAAALAAANPARPLLACQGALAREALHVVAQHEKALLRCARSLLRCQLAGEVGARAPGGERCAARAAASCRRGARKLAAAATKSTRALRDACGTLEPAALLAPSAGLGLAFSVGACEEQGARAGSPPELAACLVRQLGAAGERSVALALPRACSLLRAAALDLYPNVPCPNGQVGGSCTGLGGTWSGVTFTDQEAHDVLDLANHATAERLDAVRGIGPSLAATLIAARPLASIGDLDAVPGVGATLLGTLRAEAAGPWCTEPEASCGCG